MIDAIQSAVIKVKDHLAGKDHHGVPRDPRWPRARRDWLKDHGECEGCASTDKLEVHHVEPFHENPARELDPTNYMTLCESGRHGVNCHLALGHRGNFQNVNPDARADAAAWKAKLEAAKAAAALTGAGKRKISKEGP